MKATQCKRGHERTDANVYIEPRSGARLCRICRNERKAEWARANRNPAKPRASRAKGSPTQEAPPKRKSRLPKGWDRVTPPTPAPRTGGMKTLGDLGPVLPATPTQQAATLHVLRLMCPDDAALLADCLGIETAA